MPPAVLAVAPAIAGAAGSAAGGKKSGGAAKAAANAQFGLQKDLINKALSAWTPAANYFSALLSGDPTKIAEAVGPTSDILKGQAQTASRQLAATAPMGGEANAAQANLAQGSYNDIARLYAGVQPQAATALGQLAAAPLQLAAPNVGSGLKYDTHQQEQLSGAKGQLGTGLGQMGARSKQGKNRQAPVSTTPGSGSSKGI